MRSARGPRNGGVAVAAGGGALQGWGADPPDAEALRDRLARLRAWKVQHDQDRARQPGPFLQQAWDAVFGDEDAQVVEAIRQLEAALGGA